MEKAPPLVLLGGADAHDLVLVEMLIDDYPNIIFVVLTSLNPIIPLRPIGVSFGILRFFYCAFIDFLLLLHRNVQQLSFLWKFGDFGCMEAYNSGRIAPDM